jgi:hypothetical protein
MPMCGSVENVHDAETSGKREKWVSLKSGLAVPTTRVAPFPHVETHLLPLNEQQPSLRRPTSA